MDKIGKRHAIIEAALNRFRRFGIRKTTMQEIAEDMNLAVGTLYLYFKNKDELIIGCAEQFAENHRSFVDELMRSDLPADEKLRRYAINRFRAVKEIRAGTSHTAEIARAVIKLNPATAQEDSRQMYETVRGILAQGMERGLLHMTDPSRDAEIFLQTLAYFLPLSEAEPSVPVTEAKLCQTLDWFTGKWTEAARPVHRRPDEYRDRYDARLDRDRTAERRRRPGDSPSERV